MPGWSCKPQGGPAEGAGPKSSTSRSRSAHLPSLESTSGPDSSSHCSSACTCRTEANRLLYMTSSSSPDPCCSKKAAAFGREELFAWKAGTLVLARASAARKSLNACNAPRSTLQHWCSLSTRPQSAGGRPNGAFPPRIAARTWSGKTSPPSVFPRPVSSKRSISAESTRHHAAGPAAGPKKACGAPPSPCSAFFVSSEAAAALRAAGRVVARKRWVAVALGARKKPRKSSFACATASHLCSSRKQSHSRPLIFFKSLPRLSPRSSRRRDSTAARRISATSASWTKGWPAVSGSPPAWAAATCGGVWRRAWTQAPRSSNPRTDRTSFTPTSTRSRLLWRCDA
mmetsp:Transcript_41370/g.93198  ORF Transcript_41370/g.93198 Transcript_41370/m.93198 type:complete len:342 (+) Transcript_41370:587-1612(+)